MIQRIQSLYLLLGGTFLVAFAFLADGWASGLAESMPWLLPAAMGASALAAVVAYGSLLLYKSRDRQRRVIIAAQVLALVTVALAVAGLFLAPADGAEPVGRYLIALLPVVAYVTLRLAQRGVDKDIALVRSMDRLR